MTAQLPPGPFVERRVRVLRARHHVQVEWRLGRRPGLDGLRGVAILLVLACHLFGAARGNDRYFAVGSAGVTLFFTLSGFLITSLLLEAEPTWRSFRAFYVRRARRLFPALLCIVMVLGAFELLLRQYIFAVVPTLFYFSNWAQLGGWDLGIMRHSWSLAIEEQFYLVWPPLLFLARRWRRGPLVVAVGGVVVSSALRLALVSEGGWRIYYGSDTQAASLLIGAVLAIVAHQGLRSRTLPWWAPLTLCGFAFAHSMWTGWLVVPTVVPFAATALIWSACTHAGPVLGNALLRWVGRRSYAVYLWHYPLILVVRNIAGPSLSWGCLSVALAFACAEASWRLVESPVLRQNRPGTTRVPDDHRWGSAAGRGTVRR
jgi:peptidoglycan/LPS O-acetylase OafA/YrhL